MPVYSHSQQRVHIAIEHASQLFTDSCYWNFCAYSAVQKLPYTYINALCTGSQFLDIFHLYSKIPGDTEFQDTF